MPRDPKLIADFNETQSLEEGDVMFLDPDEVYSEEEGDPADVTMSLTTGKRLRDKPTRSPDGAVFAGPTPPDSQQNDSFLDRGPPPSYDEALEQLEELSTCNVVEVEEGEYDNESLPDLDNDTLHMIPEDKLGDDFMYSEEEDGGGDEDMEITEQVATQDSDEDMTVPDRLPTLESDDEEDLATRLPSSQESVPAGEGVVSGKRKRSGPSKSPGKKRKKRRGEGRRITQEEFNTYKAELDEELLDLRVDKDFLPSKLLKDLIAAKAVKAAMKRLANEDKHSKLIIRKIVESEEVKVSRSTTSMRKDLGLNYRKGLSESVKSQPLHAHHKRVRSVKKYELLKEKVKEFYLDDQASRACPGKADYVKVGEEKLQKRICNDYARNLHELFMLENPEMKCSMTFFWNHRPRNVLTSKYLTKDTTCCQKHQNFQLLVKALAKLLPHVKCVSSPDAFIKEYDTEEKVDQLLSTFNDDGTVTRVEFEQWGRWVDPDDGKTKTRILKHTEEVEKFLEDFSRKYTLFKEHASNATHQYREQRKMKQNLKPGECMVQVDFIQNYVCLLADAAQSSFFNQTQVTIHATCVYFKRTEDGPVEHESFVHVSPINQHHAGMVRAILTQLWETDFKEKKDELQLKKVHYYSDSPFSQYRNKYIFDFIERHEEVFGMEASWDYFESGHGKGPCDGIGGTIKRLADQAVKHGRQIQDADDFAEWGSTSTSVRFKVRLVSRELFELHKKRYLELDKELQTVAGTKKIHAVRPGRERGTIYHRDLSCKCTEEDPCPCEWKSSEFRGTTPQEDLGHEVTALTTELNVGDNCIFEFHSQVYLGQVDKIEANDQVSFKPWHREGRHIRAEFRMLESQKRIVMSKYDVHICGPLVRHRGSKWKLQGNDLNLFISKMDGLQM